MKVITLIFNGHISTLPIQFGQILFKILGCGDKHYNLGSDYFIYILKNKI